MGTLEDHRPKTATTYFMLVGRADVAVREGQKISSTDEGGFYIESTKPEGLSGSTSVFVLSSCLRLRPLFTGRDAWGGIKRLMPDGPL